MSVQASTPIMSDAFRHLKLGDFSTFDDDSEEAAAAREKYQDALDVCIKRLRPSFARSLVQIHEDTAAAKDADLGHAFVTPAGMIDLLEFQTEGVTYREDEGYIRTDMAGPHTILILRRISTVAKMSAEFREAVALRLAWSLAGRWGQTRTLKTDLARDFETQAVMAARLDANSATETRWDGLPDPGDIVGNALR